jgi:hypothetical protein
VHRRLRYSRLLGLACPIYTEDFGSSHIASISGWTVLDGLYWVSYRVRVSSCFAPTIKFEQQRRRVLSPLESFEEAARALDWRLSAGCLAYVTPAAFSRWLKPTTFRASWQHVNCRSALRFLFEHSHRLQNQYQNGRLDSVSGIMRIWPSQVPYLDKRLAPRKSSC